MKDRKGGLNVQFYAAEFTSERSQKKPGDTKSVGELGRFMNRLSSNHEGIIFALAKGNCRHKKISQKGSRRTEKLAKLAPILLS